MTWQPIETAPRDGTFVLIYDGEFVYRAYWGELSKVDDTMAWLESDEYYISDVTHWHPLDPPPTD